MGVFHFLKLRKWYQIAQSISYLLIVKISTLDFSCYIQIHSNESYVNPFVPNAPFRYPLKTSENITKSFFDVLGGERVRKGALGTNGLI